MKDREYLEEELSVIEEEISNVNKRYDRKELISLLGTVFFATLGTFTLFTMPLFGAALFGGAIGSLEAKFSNNKRMKKELERLEREKKHIQKIAENGLDTSQEMTEKRIRKVKSLIVENNRKTNNYKAWRSANNIALAGIGASLAVATIMPVIGLAAAAVTTAAKLITGNRLNNSHEELQINKNRVNNLITDVNTIKLATRNNKPRKVDKQPAQASKGRTNSRQPQRARQQQTTASSQNAQSVQKYIDSLARQQVQTSKVKQKSKY